MCRAGGRSRARRSGDRAAPARRVHRHSTRRRTFTGTFCLQTERRRPSGDAHWRRLSSPAAVLLSGLEFPEELRCRTSKSQPPPRVGRLCIDRRAGFPGPCRLSVRWPYRENRIVVQAAVLEHDPEKWEPVFRKDHAPLKIQRRATTLASLSLAVLLTTISSTANLPRSRARAR